MYFLFKKPWYQFPHDSGFFIFTIGILFVLTVYHLLLFFQHRDKSYLLYSAYTLFIILSQIRFSDNGFLDELLFPIAWIKNFPQTYTEAYYIIYVFFALKFLDTHKEFPKQTKIIKIALFVISALSLLKFLYYIISLDELVQMNGYFIFVIIITVLSIYAYIIFFKQKNKLKYYIIIGGLFLSICSYLSLWQYLDYIKKNEDISPAYTILYIGFILENVLFALGLGQKQKHILLEKNESQNTLISKMRENEALRKQVQEQLKKEVTILNENAKQERLLNIKLEYEKDLAELKVVALRQQMNPHFIFNSLNSIKRYIIDNETENAVYYLNKFSKLIRLILSNSMEGNITLEEEIETAKLYIYIENIRFNNEIDAKISIDKDINLNKIKIPSLILQPFIENAIWHGLSLKKGRKQIFIKVKKIKNNTIEIIIEDNGIGRKKSNEIKTKKIHKRESAGLKITQERLNHFTKKAKSSLKLHIEDIFDSEGKPSGTRVSLKIKAL